MNQQHRDIIVFDGHCILCSANARFVIRHDKHHRFALAPMQGEAGRAIYVDAGIDPSNPETLVVVAADGVLRNSDAVIHIYRHLGWPWRAAAIFAFLPRIFRDPLYRIIARNRYRLFRRRETCWLPDAAHRHRLL